MNIRKTFVLLSISFFVFFINVNFVSAQGETFGQLDQSVLSNNYNYNGFYQTLGNGLVGDISGVHFKVKWLDSGGSTDFHVAVEEYSSCELSGGVYSTGYVRGNIVNITSPGTAGDQYIDIVLSSVLDNLDSDHCYQFLFGPASVGVHQTFKIYGSGSDKYSGGSIVAGSGGNITPLYDAYFIVDGVNIPFSFYFPVDSFIYRNDFNVWSLSIPVRYASTSLKMLVLYGMSVGDLVFGDSSFLISSNVNSIYSVLKSKRLILSTATSTWYAQAGLYADYNNDGVFNNFVASTSVIGFIVGPGSYSSGQTLLNGEQVFYNYYQPPVGTTTVSDTCDDFTSYLGGNVCHLFQAMFVPSESSLSQFSGLWRSLQYKAPWGYFMLAYSRFPYLLSTNTPTELSTTSSSTILNYFNIYLGGSSYFQSVIDVFKIFVIAVTTILGMWLLIRLLMTTL